MINPQDTVTFTETERTLMAQALRDQAQIIRTDMFGPARHGGAVHDETRVTRLWRADTLMALADDVEWGHRR